MTHAESGGHLSDERLAILESSGDGDTQDLVTEVRRLRDALWKVRANANIVRQRAKESDKAVPQQWLNVEFVLNLAGIPPSRNDSLKAP